MESEHEKRIEDRTNKAPEGDGSAFPEQKAKDFSSASSVSSSSSSSSEHGIRERGSFGDSSFKSKFDGSLSPGLESISSPESSHTAQWSMLSASPEVSTLRSPQIQTMGYPLGYDPNRIPSSIFSTKATNPMEWSTTSNESLFSIHMGKSGELFRLDEWNYAVANYACNYDGKSSELSSTLPPVMEVPAHEESSAKSSNASGHDKQGSHDENSSRHGKQGSHDGKQESYDGKQESYDGINVALENHGSKKSLEVTHHPPSTTHRPSTSNPRLSVESGNSSSSFAFPLLVNDGSKTCSQRESSEKHEKPEFEEQEKSKETHKTSNTTRWFSCSSCWPRWCC